MSFDSPPGQTTDYPAVTFKRKQEVGGSWCTPEQEGESFGSCREVMGKRPLGSGGADRPSGQ